MVGLMSVVELRMTFAGDKVVNPANCTVGNVGEPTGTITTSPLVDKIMVDPVDLTGPVFDRFTPELGSTFTEAAFHGEACTLNEFALSGQWIGDR